MHALHTETYSKLQPTPNGLLYQCQTARLGNSRVPRNPCLSLIYGTTALLDVDCRPEDLIKGRLKDLISLH